MDYFDYCKMFEMPDEAALLNWVDTGEKLVSGFLDAIPDGSSDYFDMSPLSLVKLESWLLDTYPTIESLRNESQAPLVLAASFYLGETVRLGCNSRRWYIATEDKSNRFYKLACVIGERFTQYYPVGEINNVVLERTGKVLQVGRVFPNE